MRKYTFEKVQSYIVILIIKKERKSMQAKKFLATLLAVTMTAAPTVPYPVSAAETEVHGENDRQVQEEEQSTEETTQTESTEDTEQEIQLNEEFLQILSKTAVWDGDSILIDVVTQNTINFISAAVQMRKRIR